MNKSIAYGGPAVAAAVALSGLGVGGPGRRPRPAGPGSQRGMWR
jgi:hypothetical protein